MTEPRVRPTPRSAPGEPAAKAKRWSKNAVRAAAWLTGIATFAAGAGALWAAPKPAAAAVGTAAATPPRPVVVHRVIRRVIVVDKPNAPAPVYVPAPSNSGGGYVPPPPPAPTTSSGGSGG